MIETSPTTCAVVVTYNRWLCLQTCLEGLRKQTFPLSEVIVIDNASEDGTREGVLQHYPWVSYIQLPENVGGAGGFSEGIRVAAEKGFDWIWVMDDDAVPEPDSLEKLVGSEMILRPETGALACLVVGSDGQIDERARAHWLDMRAFRTKPVFISHGPAGGAIEFNSGTFVGILIRRTVIERVGLPRADFFIAFDDVEYIYRIHEAGLKAYLIPMSRIVHLNAGMEDQVGRASKPFARPPRVSALWKCYYGWRNTMYVVRKYSTPWAFLRKSGRLIVGIILFDDHKVRRLYVLGQAIRDALAGRLGRRVLPPRSKTPSGKSIAAD